MEKTITASEIKVGQKVKFVIDGELKTECKVTSAWLNDDCEVVIRAAHWFLTLPASQYCVLVTE